MAKTTPQVLTVAEVAMTLRYTPQTIREMIKHRRLRATRFNRRWRITREAVEAFLRPKRRRAS